MKRGIDGGVHENHGAESSTVPAASPQGLSARGVRGPGQVTQTRRQTYLQRWSVRFLVALAACFVVLAPGVQAREGYVVCRTGAVLEGHIRFVPGAVIVASSARGIWEQIGLTNVHEVGLAPVRDELWAGGPPGLWAGDSHPGYAPRTMMVGGSVHVGAVASVDDSSVRFAGGRRPPLAIKAVASINFRPVPYRSLRRVSAGEPGVVLKSGEFVAGEIRGLRNGQVTVSSIPFGLVHYNSATEVTAVVLRKPAPSAREACRLQMADGSVWLGSSITIDGHWVVVRSASFGVRRVPLYEVVEMRWGRTV